MRDRVAIHLTCGAALLIACGCGSSTSPTLTSCSVTPTHLVFDAAHPVQSFVVANTGIHRLVGRALYLGDFYADRSYDLLPGQKDTVTVQFRPRAAGHLSASIGTGCAAEVLCEGDAVSLRRQMVPLCDTYTTPAQPDQVFDLAPLLWVGDLGPAPPTGFEQAFLRFDLFVVPPSHVSRATLALYQNGCESDGTDLPMVCGATRDTVDCSTATATTLDQSFYVIDTVRPVDCTPGIVEFDVTSIVAAHLTGVDDIRGFVVMPVASGSAPSRHRFDSMEGPHRPVLTIDYFAPK